jgi:hypothetical protein
VVVLSPAFFGKRWTNYELDGLVSLPPATPTKSPALAQAGVSSPSGTKSVQTTLLGTALHSLTWWRYKVAMAWSLSLSVFELPCGLPAPRFCSPTLS